MKSQVKKSTTKPCGQGGCRRAAGHKGPCSARAAQAHEADRAASYSTDMIVERILSDGLHTERHPAEYRAWGYELAVRVKEAQRAAPSDRPRPNQIMDREICALAEPCPDCGAAVGERCIDRPLHVSMPQIHGPRYVAAGLDPAGRQAADRCQTCPEPDDRCADCSGCPDHCVCDSEWDEEEPEVIEAADSGARQCPMLSGETRTRCVRRPQHTGQCRFEPKSRALRPSYAPEDRVLCAPGCALPHLHLAPCQDDSGETLTGGAGTREEIAAAIKAGEHPADILRRAAYAAVDEAVARIRRAWGAVGDNVAPGPAARIVHEGAKRIAESAMESTNPRPVAFEADDPRVIRIMREIYADGRLNLRNTEELEAIFRKIESASPAASSREEQE